MQQGLDKVLAHGAVRQAQLPGDLALGQAVQVIQHKGLACLFLHAFENKGDLLQGFQGGENLLRRLKTFEGFGGQGQFLQIGVFYLFAAHLIDDEPACCSAQKGPGLAQGGDRLAGIEDSGEGVLGQIGGIVRATEFSAQPAK